MTATRRGRATHELKCAERIRLRALVRAGEADPPEVTSLHRVAQEIQTHCGHRALKAHRLAWGWTVDQAVRELHLMCDGLKLGTRGLGERSWLGWEAGGRPDHDYRDRLCRLFQTSPVRLGFASDYTPSTHEGVADPLSADLPSGSAATRFGSQRDDGTSWFSAARAAETLQHPRDADHAHGAGDDTTGRGRESGNDTPRWAVDGLSVVERLELVRREVHETVSAGASTPASLDDWERTALRHGRATRYRPPAELLTKLGADYADLERELARRQTSPALRRLTRVAAQLAGLVFLTLVKLNQPVAAGGWARTARMTADLADDPTVRSWVLAQEAYLHYYGGDPTEAIDVARHAQAVGGGMACTGVPLAAALEARAHALLGRDRETTDARERAQAGLARLDAGSLEPSAFGYDEAQLHFHAGNAHTHLHDTEAAWTEQRRALDLYPDSDYLDRTLVRLDRVSCLAHDGDVSTAMTRAIEAVARLSSEQRTGLILVRGHEILDALTPRQRRQAAAREFRDLLTPPGGDDERRSR